MIASEFFKGLTTVKGEEHLLRDLNTNIKRFIGILVDMESTVKYSTQWREYLMVLYRQMDAINLTAQHLKVDFTEEMSKVRRYFETLDEQCFKLEIPMKGDKGGTSDVKSKGSSISVSK